VQTILYSILPEELLYQGNMKNLKLAVPVGIASESIIIIIVDTKFSD